MRLIVRGLLHGVQKLHGGHFWLPYVNGIHGDGRELIYLVEMYVS
jgi:hypothetical protein